MTYCCCCTQAATVRKAEEKSASDALLAKLHYGVVEFLKEASKLLYASSGDWNDVSDKFKVSTGKNYVWFDDRLCCKMRRLISCAVWFIRDISNFARVSMKHEVGDTLRMTIRSKSVLVFLWLF